MKQSYSIILIIAILFTAGCEPSAPTYDYSIDQKWICFCPADDGTRIFIVADSIVNAIRLNDGTRLPKEQWTRCRTISGLFAEIARWDTSRFTVHVTYDPVYGYPTVLSVNPKPIVTDTLVSIISDGGFTLETSNYKTYR